MNLGESNFQTARKSDMINELNETCGFKKGDSWKLNKPLNRGIRVLETLQNGGSMALDSSLIHVYYAKKCIQGDVADVLIGI